MIAAWLLTVAVAHAQDWRLVAAYDPATLATLEDVPPSYVWEPADGMATSCGPAKRPDGLGIFEAEAVGAGLTPSLLLLLEHVGDDRGHPLSTDDVRVAVGEGDDRVLLQPIVEPRHLVIGVRGGDGTERYEQLVRTQIEVETCLEHKTGRGWTGRDTGRLRQAFLLDPPLGLEASRKFFGGQQDPVPALLGPPDACLLPSSILSRRATGGRGEGSLSLVPTDVWGANLRTCLPIEAAGERVLADDRRLPLHFTGEPTAFRRAAPRWHALTATLTLDPGDEPEEERVRVELVHDGRTLVAGDLFEPQPDGPPGIVDLLAAVPHTYPTVGPDDDPHRYTVLVVPNWQIVEALRRLERTPACPDDPADPRCLDKPMGTPPVGVVDGVGTVLSRPELLSVQLRPEGEEGDWPNLSRVMRTGMLEQPFGFTVGQLAARSPVVMPRAAAPTWLQTAAAQRAPEQAILLLSVVLVLGGLLAGLTRLRDLWTRVPTERADYWPGAGEVVLSETPSGTPVEEDPP